MDFALSIIYMYLIELLHLFIQVNEMANEVLKQIFQDMGLKIVITMNPDLIIDELLSQRVISVRDHSKLRQFPNSRDRCRELLSILKSSSDPQAFIRLRLALLDEYPWIVDEIDKQLPLLTSQLQQLQLTHSTEGKFLLPGYT